MFKITGIKMDSLLLRLISSHCIMFFLLLSSNLSASDMNSKRNIRYDIDAEINLEFKEIIASAKITIPNHALSNKNYIYLKAKATGLDESENCLIKINKISVDGTTPLDYEYEAQSDTLKILLPKNISNENFIRLVIDYILPLHRGDPPWRKEYSKYGYYVFACDEDYAYWYPEVFTDNRNEYRFRDFFVTILYPKIVSILTTGNVIDTPDSVDNKIRCVIRAESVEGFALNFGEGYVLREIEKDDFKVYTFSPPELTEKFLEAAKFTLDAVAWYKKVYGFFPVQSIGIASGHETYSGGFPTSNMFYIHRGGTLQPEFLRRITAHELGHYYWGLYVLSPSAIRLDWLMLANGIWIDELYSAKVNNQSLNIRWKNGPWYKMYMDVIRNNWDERLGISPEEEQQLKFSYNMYVNHAKAAVGIYLLSYKLGYDKFMELQKTILEDYRYRTLSVRQFAEYVEKAGVGDAYDFLVQWQRGDASIIFKKQLEDVFNSSR